MNTQKNLFEVPIDLIIPNRFQPREHFDEEELNKLSQSIREHGIIQPLVLRKIGDKYEIVAGERRYKAAIMAGLNRVPAVVADLNDAQSAEIALIENIQRQDLSPIEEARTYQKILDMGYLTQEQLANKVGKAQPTVANKLRLLNLDDEVQDALLKGKISERHARALLNIDSKEEQKNLLQEIIDQRLSVRDTDLLISKKANPSFVTAPEIEIISDDEEDGSNEEKILPRVDLNNINKEIERQPISNPNPMPGSINPDLNKIMEQAIDINPEKELAPMDDFLTVKKDNQYTEEPKSKFFIPLDDIEDEYTNKDAPLNNFNDVVRNINVDSAAVNKTEPIETVQKTYSDYVPPQLERENLMNEPKTSAVHNVRDAVGEIRKSVDSIQRGGVNVDTEEFDFEGMYQIIVKIYK
ncbi:MAG: ParB/RepB/Spo0J family partition protein [Bacilli bacterium]|nr:ParB/RepB/Spo0J family partition protein [Bacilli bacterium]